MGGGVAGGEVVKWLVTEGDAVREDQPMVEVMTDKATVETPPPATGRVQRIVAQAGQVVPVGAVLVVLELAAGAAAPRIAAHGGGHAAPAAAPPKHAPAPTPPAAAAPARPSFQRPPGQRAISTPATRRLAREKGVDIEKVEGTGPAGRVTDEDVARAAAGGAVAAPPGAAPQGAGAAIAPAAPPRPAAAARGDEVVPIRGLRRKIYERMALSKSHAAHFSYVDDMDVTELVALRNIMKERAKLKGVRLTFLPFVMKALVDAFRLFPTLNATVDEAAGTYTVRGSCNFGIAVDTDAGLIVPVVKGVERRSLLDLPL